MALEAVKQMANPHERILGYNIKEASFTSPIIIHRDQTVEVTTALRPLTQAYEKSSQRFQVQLLAYIDLFWSECFSATIHIQYDEPDTEADRGQEARHEAQRHTQRYMQANDDSTRCIDKRRIYQWLDEQGLKYGKQFSLADDVYWDGHAQTTTKVNVEPPLKAYAGTVHPAVFDAACQICYVAPSEGMSESLPTIVAYKMRSAWISAKGWQYPETKQIRVATESRLKTIGSGIQTSVVILGDDGSPLCHIDDFEFSPVLSSDASESAKKTKSLYRIEWKPQLSLLSIDASQTYCGAVPSECEGGNAGEDFFKPRKALQSIVKKIAPRLRGLDASMVPLHIQKYVLWVLSQDESFQDSAVATLAEVSPDPIPEDLLKQPSWRIFSEISQYLANIGNTQSLSPPAIQDFHQNLLDRVCDTKVARYLELLVHQSPGLKILEVGSGGDMGAINGFLLSTLNEVERRTGGVAFAEYVYTDASTECLNQARESLKDRKDRVACKTLDFNGDTSKQGLESGLLIFRM